MKTKKKFDCLHMKQTIQAQLRKQWHSLSREKIRQDLARFLAGSENSVAAWWRSLNSSKSPGAR